MDNRGVYVDLDGVLADFDTLAQQIVGTDNTYKWEWIHGPSEFWAKLNDYDEFFFNLPVMPGAFELWRRIEHTDPIILTALPRTGADAVASQKRRWVEKTLGNVPVITCQTKEKPNYCDPGDILIDDRAVNLKAWGRRGGDFILHTSAAETIARLDQLKV